MLDVATSVVLIAAAATLVYRGVLAGPGAPTAAPELPSDSLSLDGAPLRGSDRASAILVVYSDFQCPFCGRFAREVLPEIERRYVATGQVALAFRHLPLPIHPLAVQASVVAECAGQQGRFWEAHDLLFAQSSLSEEVLRALPTSMGVEPQEFEDCLLDEDVRQKVQASADEAAALGVRATPGFFVGRRLDDGRLLVTDSLFGARPAAEFVELLDSVLARDSRWPSWLSFAR
jgi:protein-disulfide isomerase